MGSSDETVDKKAVVSETGADRRSRSMHEDIPVWYDCCSCEAEPYWVEAMASELSTEKDSKRQR